MDQFRVIAGENFAAWNKALLSRDAERVASLYAEDATFLPTMSDKFKMGKDGARGYFLHFLEKNPSGSIVEEAIQSLAANCYLHSGMYNFEIGPVRNRQTIEARFTFVWRKSDQGDWQILHHHSSLKPEPKV